MTSLDQPETTRLLPRALAQFQRLPWVRGWYAQKVRRPMESSDGVYLPRARQGDQRFDTCARTHAREGDDRGGRTYPCLELTHVPNLACWGRAGTLVKKVKLRTQ